MSIDAQRAAERKMVVARAKLALNEQLEVLCMRYNISPGEWLGILHDMMADQIKAVLEDEPRGG